METINQQEYNQTTNKLDEQTLKFKTNIKCSGCIAKVSPFLNNESEIEKWDVDITSLDKTLTVKSSPANAQKVIEAVEKAGFQIESINP